MYGNEDGEIGVDDDGAPRGFEGIGAYILGRNIFGSWVATFEAEPRGRGCHELKYNRRNARVT